MGCTTMFVLLLIGLAVLVGVTWWGFGRLVREYTSSEPIAIHTETSEADFSTANGKFNALQQAVRSRQSITVQFTAAEVNALIARHPEFSDFRDKFRVALADSTMTVDMSVPLREIDLPTIRNRWLNGTARFGLIYHDGNFNLALHSLSANERKFPLDALGSAFGSLVDERANDYLAKSRRDDERTNEFWENAKTVAVIDDKVVITTKGPEAPEADSDTDDAEPTPTPPTTI